MDTIKYWEAHYAEESTKSLYPSQFAAFCLNEMPYTATIIDCGCGNGRDSLFFARYGKSVIGLDGSNEAVKSCKKQAKSLALQETTFQIVDFAEPSNCQKSKEALQELGREFTIYSRFFLHAIDESVEENFLNFCCDVGQSGGLIFLEFRTSEDESQQKVEPKHYRRFINLNDFKQRVLDKGMSIEYCEQGYGFAKYKTEDAYVARLILKIA